MYLTRHLTSQGPRWARDGYFLNSSLHLSFMLTQYIPNSPRES